jgi:hypothetical protein
VVVEVRRRQRIPNSKTVITYDFEADPALDDWQLDPDKVDIYYTIDDSTSYEGSSSLKASTDECLYLSTVEDLPVTSGEIYEISFATKKGGETNLRCPYDLSVMRCRLLSFLHIG